jgi:4a-hydroxytetrahydrobiopterin dehydratase
MSLSNENCVECKGGVEALSEASAKQLLAKEIPNWNLIDNSKKLQRKFEFKNFKQSLAFVNKVGEIAEAQKHHPDINFGWGYAEIIIQTHSIGGLHQNDFILAAKIDAVLLA